MTSLALLGAGIVVGFIAGLLVGRKNPKVADTAVKLADKVK